MDSMNALVVGYFTWMVLSRNYLEVCFRYEILTGEYCFGFLESSQRRYDTIVVNVWPETDG